MNKNDLFYAFADLDETQINKSEEAETKKTFKRTWQTASKRRIVLAAICMCVLIGLGCVFGFLSKRNSLPFVLNAYAIDDSGSTITNELTLQDDFPVSVFPYDRQNSAFVFSYPSTVTDEKPHTVIYYSSASSPIEGADIMYSITGAETGFPTAGSIYIYYVFQEESPTYEFTYRTATFDENRSYNVNIRIYQKDGKYYAHLDSVTEVSK